MRIKPFFCVLAAIVFMSLSALGDIPPEDMRLSSFRSTNSPYPVPSYADRAAWQERAKELRQHILISCGLWPMPERTALNAKVFGKIERSGYSVEKVYFESRPGLYVVGNLYRPVGKEGPFPGILSAHGHWGGGRFENSETASVPGRAINLALQGYVVFSYSMLGNNEVNGQISHSFGGDWEQLWGTSAMGVQLWNSIRALDFLTSLADVDGARIGMTGASGGGTQTFMLSAVDDRIKVSAPVNMISLHFQGGCVCENAPNLRIGTNNVEIGALMAPRPLLMVSASGDWTADTPSVEYPAIRNVYRFWQAEDRIKNAHFNCGHNYNKDSREAVYSWFGRWLQPENKTLNTKEVEFQVEPEENLKVFNELPAGALSQAQLLEYMIVQAKKAIQSRMPQDVKQLGEYREVFGAVLRDVLGASVPCAEQVVSYTAQQMSEGSRLYLGRRGGGERIPAVLFWPSYAQASGVTLVSDGAGLAGQVDGLKPRGGSLTASLVSKGYIVLVLEAFPAGGVITPPEGSGYLTTYNRAAGAEAVQDILTGVGFLQQRVGTCKVQMIGIGRAGLTVFLAGGFCEQASVVIADIDGFDNSSDGAFLEKLNIPLLRRGGDLTTAGAMLAPKRLVLFNTGSKFSGKDISSVYKAACASEMLSIVEGQQTVEEIVSRL